jgi:hypothetical protein
MPRQKQIGICTGCRQLKPLFDTKHMICSTCSGKKGGSTPKTPRTKYFCDACGKRLKKGQETCACGAKLDWNTLTLLVNQKNFSNIS